MEANVSIICSCLPCIRLLLARWLPRIFTSRHKSTGNSNLPSNLAFDRSTYGRHTNRDIVLVTIEKDDKRRPADLESQDDVIKVVTEVRINHDDLEAQRSGNHLMATGRVLQSENSTESLVSGGIFKL